MSVTQKFSGFVAQIAVDLGLLSDIQRQEVLSTQAKLLALGRKGIKPTEKFLDKDALFKAVVEAWDRLANEHKITNAELQECLALVSAGDGIKATDAPASGDIAVALSFISKDIKSAILTAQAAVRSQHALDKLDNPDVKAKTPEEIERQHGRIDYEGKFDPKELVAAQITNKEADEFAAAYKNDELDLAHSATVKKAALYERTSTAYKAAAEMFRRLDIPAARLIGLELGRAAEAIGLQKINL